MTFRPVSPPEPTGSWPPNIELVSGTFETTGETMFESSGGEWSRGRRSDNWVELEWEDERFRLTRDRVIIDSSDPTEAVDLNWNMLLATVCELRGTPAIHGFMAVTPSNGGVAVLGLSGAGKTTTGGALLDLGCKLVADDLIILEPDGVPPGRPFVRQVDPDAPDEELDIGGKVRVPARTADDPVRLSNVLVLCPDDVPQLQPLDSLTATNLLLQGSYVPFEVSAGTARTRLEWVLNMLNSGVTVSAARSRTRTPHEFASYLIDQATAATAT